MERIFITNLVYNNINFFIYMINGKLEVFTNELNIDSNTIKEIKNIIDDNNKIYRVFSKNIRPIIGGAILLTSLNFLGTYKTTDIDKITTISYEEEFDLYDEYLQALNDNKNLSDEDRLVFLEQFEYVKNNYEYFTNIDFTLQTLRNIKIIRYDNEDDTLVGYFKVENGNPRIYLYKDSTKETLIHEIYHALKYNTYYYDECYLYNERFIGTEGYNKLSDEDKKKCIKYDLNGKFFEEAHTSLLATATKDINNLDIDYEKEASIYKMYEKIFGKEIMEKNMLNNNKIIIFLNSLIDLGINYNEAAAIVTRLDLYESLRQNLDVNYNNPSLSYQICNDLAYVYEKKFNNTDDYLLELTTLAFVNNLNKDTIQDFSSNYNMINFYKNFVTGEMSIKSILESFNYPADIEYGVNDIKFDYFSNKEIYIYIEIDKRKTVILSLDNENHLKFVKSEVEKEPYELKLYDDYYEFAMNSYDNERYARFFAGCYANTSLSEDERVQIMRTYEKLTGDLDSDEFKTLLLFGNYDRIMNIFETKLYRNDFKKR